MILRIQYNDSISEQEIAPPPQEDTICILRALENTILNEIVLTGINRITSASMICKKDIYKYNVETSNYDNIPEWVIDTEGSNLIDIVKHPAIDPVRTISNDIHEVYDVLGIEACRHVLINEINQILNGTHLLSPSDEDSLTFRIATNTNLGIKLKVVEVFDSTGSATIFKIDRNKAPTESFTKLRSGDILTFDWFISIYKS